MGYVGNSLAELGDLSATREAARRITPRAGRLLHRQVVDRTPVAEEAPVWRIEGVDFVRARGGRVPGTLRNSWKLGTLEARVEGGTYSVDVWTDDPVAVYVEYPTRPHVIRARRVSNLRFPDETGTRFRFTPEVHHPGTQGSYMLRDSLALLRMEWEAIAREELRDIGREQIRHVQRSEVRS